MVFVVLVAADIFGNKTNFELQFANRPPLVELTRAVEQAFSNEIALRRPDGVPQHSFHIAKMKVFDEPRNKWVDLLSESQLDDYCQIYAFQPENPWHKESQKEIPLPTKPPQAPSSVLTRTASSSKAPPVYTSTTTQQVSSLTTSSSTTGRYARQPSGSVPLQQLTAGGPPSLDASEDEKIRTVFAEMDIKNNRMIDMEDLKQGFRTLGIEFTTATMNDLFQKGDLNQDGRISFGEFERFARNYPIMIDCLFYRSRAFWDDQNMSREIDGDKDAVRAAFALVNQAQQQQAQAQKVLEDTTNQIMEAEGDMKDKQGRARDIQSQFEQATRDKDRAQKEKYERENEAVTQRDRERQARQAQQDLAREVDKLERRCVQNQQEAAKADEKVKILQQQLLDAQRVYERALQQAKQSAAEVDTARGRERDAGKAADGLARDIARFEDALRQAENNFVLANERIRELEIISRDLSREADEANRRKEAAERAAQAAKDHELAMQNEVANARRNAEERERQQKAREAELLEQQRQRQLVSQHERALIEQELRLREQRDSLEEKEGRLKSEATQFLSTLRTAVTQQRYGREISNTTPYTRDPVGYRQ